MTVGIGFFILILIIAYIIYLLSKNTKKRKVFVKKSSYKMVPKDGNMYYQPDIILLDGEKEIIINEPLCYTESGIVKVLSKYRENQTVLY